MVLRRIAMKVSMTRRCSKVIAYSISCDHLSGNLVSLYILGYSATKTSARQCSSTTGTLPGSTAKTIVGHTDRHGFEFASQ